MKASDFDFDLGLDHTGLSGFDIAFESADCSAMLEWDEPRTCPWTPGCGLPLAQCPLREEQRRLRARILAMPRRVQ